MEVDEALSRISEIHEQLARGETYRGYRAAPIVFTGLMALVAAALQPIIPGTAAGEGFIGYWVAVAAISAVVGHAGIAYAYLCRSNPRVRAHTRTVVGQFAPALVAGIVLTAAIAKGPQGAVEYLPGVWALLFSLGVFATRPYLPKAIGWTALFYLASSAVLFALAERGNGLAPWGMGVTFGVGQMMVGGVLYWDLERNHDGN